MRKEKLGMLTAALLTSVLGFGETFTDGNGLVWTYTTSSGKATLSKVVMENGNAVSGALEIPATVIDDTTSASATVTAIAADAFKNLAITSLTFAEGTKTIEYGAFAGCSSLESVMFPDSLTTIYGARYTNTTGAFANCTALTNVTFGSGIVTLGGSSDHGVFANCDKLESVVFGPNLKYIGELAFTQCISLKKIVLPDTVEKIYEKAFYHNTALESVEFGTGLTSIGENAFYNCPELQSVVFRENDTPLLSIGANVFALAAKLRTLTFSETLKTIEYGAFAGCSSLESVVFPDSLTTIYGARYTNTTGAFANCTALTNVSFWNRIASIGEEAFYNCESLISLDFPDTLKTIGDYCSYNNIRLVSVTFGANLQEIGKCAFMGCVSLNSVSFSPATTPLLTIKSNAFKNCQSLASLTLSNAMPTIESGAFYGCTMLRRITIPSLMSTINSGVFSSMSKLKEIIFLGLPPENLENAGLTTEVSIRYPSEYAEDWEEVIATCGFANASVYEPDELGGIVGDSRYGLSTTPSDRSIASITVDSDYVMASFSDQLTSGKVYDSVLRIVNTANQDVTLTLPAGFEYETFEGADPLTIPANSRNILTITRTAENTFLVSREKLRVL